MKQPSLFASMPEGPALARMCRAAKKRVAECLTGLQLRLEFPWQAEDQIHAAHADDDGDGQRIDPPIIHRIVNAETARRVTPTAASSIFGWTGPTLADKKRLSTQRGGGVTVRISRSEGLVKCERILPQDTDEWKLKEAIRRAKQTPPRPGAQYVGEVSSRFAKIIKGVK